MMKLVWNFLLYAALFFVVVFGINYSLESWIAHRGRALHTMLIESGVAAVVFAIFMCMVLLRSRKENETPKDKE